MAAEVASPLPNACGHTHLSAHPPHLHSRPQWPCSQSELLNSCVREDVTPQLKICLQLPFTNQIRPTRSWVIFLTSYSHLPCANFPEATACQAHSTRQPSSCLRSLLLFCLLPGALLSQAPIFRELVPMSTSVHLFWNNSWPHQTSELFSLFSSLLSKDIYLSIYCPLRRWEP